MALTSDFKGSIQICQSFMKSFSLRLETPIAVSLLLALIATFSAPAAEAATLELLGVRWEQVLITYEISASANVDPNAIAVVQDVIDDWNDLLGGFDFAMIPHNGIGRPDLTILLKGGGDSTVGRTSIQTINPFSCVIGSARITLRGKAFGQDFSQAGVGNITRHEIGHVLGLGHSDDPNDLMYYLADSAEIFGEISVPVSECDMAGIAILYSGLNKCSFPSSIECE
jgi:hypothetical protein